MFLKLYIASVLLSLVKDYSYMPYTACACMQIRGGWSRFSRNVIIINAHHNMSSTVFVDLDCGGVR